jgi:hypothetical protein
MAQLGQAFDPASAPQDDRSFDLIPNGWYPAQAIEADVQPTKSGNGQIIVLTWEIMQGPCEKRRVWQRINYINQNAQAQEIGQRELGGLCRALNLGPIQDTDVLKFKPVQIRVGVEKGDSQFEDKNQVKGFKPYGQGAPAPQPAGAPPASQPQGQAGGGTAPQAASGGAARPWAR